MTKETARKKEFFKKFLISHEKIEEFIFYMTADENDEGAYSSISQLIEANFEAAIEAAFDWNNTSNERVWIELDRKWLKHLENYQGLKDRETVFYIGHDNNIKNGLDYGQKANDRFYKEEWSYDKLQMESILKNEYNNSRAISK